MSLKKHAQTISAKRHDARSVGLLRKRMRLRDENL
jgi:hypothetical protein